MRILHICAGWQRNNGAAVIARLIADEQRMQGEEVRLGTWASVRELRAADIVWVHCGWLPCLWWASLFAKRLIRMPEACYDPIRLDYHGWKKRLVRPIERFFLRRATKVLVTCEAEARWIRDYEPRANVEITDIKRFFDLNADRVRDTQNLAKCHVATTAEGLRHNGISPSMHLLYLGRRHPLKGLEYLERAVAEVNAAIEQSNNQNNRTIDLRVVSNAVGEELEKVWEWCDVLVLPTLSENFGLVVAEALERGKRVVTTDGAPAWGEGGLFDCSDCSIGYGGRLVYLKGFREGTDEERVELLKRGLRESGSGEW